jgi:DNA-binding PadR family transcriptional regulator
VTDPYGDPGTGIGLAARVILHLGELARLGPNDVAPFERTQPGMIQALDVRQPSLVKVLQRLRVGEVVEVERRFVGRTSRRMKVYRLTALGESAARDLRHRAPLPVPSPAPNDGWVAAPAPESGAPGTRARSPFEGTG